MNDEILQKMQQDVAALERQIAGKTAILKEVYGELRATQCTSRRNTVAEILGVCPVAPVTSSFARCSLPSSVGFLDGVAVSIEVENNSSRCELSARGKILLSSTTSSSLLLNSKGEHVESLRSRERGVLLISFPLSLFISHSVVNLVIDVTWMLPNEKRSIPIPLMSLLEQTEEDVHPLESYVIPVEEPREWKTLSDILSCDERDATRIQQYASVSMISRDFAPLPSYEFRALFPRFDVADFGEWQLFVGTGSFSGLLVGSSTKGGKGLDRVYAQSSHSLDAFLSLLEEKLSTTHK